MVFFPEGTRSPDGKLREFKSGAFRIAMDEKVDVIPIVLQGTRDMMVKNSALPKPAHLRIEVLPAMKPQENETVEAYTSRVHAVIAERLSGRVHCESQPPSKDQKEKRSSILTSGQISPTV